MAKYVQRLEDNMNDGMDIHEVLPSSRDEEDGVLSPVAAAAASQNMRHNTNARSNEPTTGYHCYQYPQQDPPGVYAAVSYQESEISFGASFDQVFDMEIGNVPTGKLWDEMRLLLSNGDDQATSKSGSSSKSAGSRKRMNNSSAAEQLLPKAESDLDQIFDELTEQQEAEEKFMEHISTFRRQNGSASGLYGTPLCSLMENACLEEQENDSGSSNGSRHKSSQHSKKNGTYEDDGLLPPKSSLPPLPPPLSNISKLNHQELHTRKAFVSGGNEQPLSEKDAHMLATRAPMKDDDDTAMTSVLTQSTYSYPPVAIAPIASKESESGVMETSFSPASPVEILHDMDQFLHKVEMKKISKQLTQPRTTRRDSFDSQSNRISIATTKQLRRPYKSVLSELLEATTNLKISKSTEDTNDVSESSDADVSESNNSNNVTNGTDNTTIATVSESGNDEDRLRLSDAHEKDTLPVQAVDAVLNQEYGIWHDMDRWDKNPDGFAVDLDITNMRSPSGCVDAPSIFKDKNMNAIGEILQNRDSHSDTDENSDVSSLTDHSTDRISIHDDEIDVQIVSSKDEKSEETSTTNTITAPESVSNSAQEVSRSSLSSQSDELSFAVANEDENCEGSISQSSISTEAPIAEIDIFAKNEVWRSINAIAEFHHSRWNDVFPEDDYQVFLELRHQRLFAISTSHAMLQSRVGGVQMIGLTLLLNGGDINTSLWI